MSFITIVGMGVGSPLIRDKHKSLMSRDLERRRVRGLRFEVLKRQNEGLRETEGTWKGMKVREKERRGTKLVFPKNDVLVLVGSSPPPLPALRIYISTVIFLSLGCSCCSGPPERFGHIIRSVTKLDIN